MGGWWLLDWQADLLAGLLVDTWREERWRDGRNQEIKMKIQKNPASEIGLIS